MLKTTPTVDMHEDLVGQAIRGMSAVQRARLEHYARGEGITPEAAVVQIVAQGLKAARR